VVEGLLSQHQALRSTPILYLERKTEEKKKKLEFEFHKVLGLKICSVS
jgi:hypothetical protein